jgi:hypothetical protein
VKSSRLRVPQVPAVLGATGVLALGLGGCGGGGGDLTDSSTCANWNSASIVERIGFMQHRGLNNTTDYALVTAAQAASLLTATCSGVNDGDPSTIGSLADTIIGPSLSDGGTDTSRTATDGRTTTRTVT